MTALRLENTADNILRLIFDMPNSRANTLGQAILAEWEQVLSDLEGRQDVRGMMLVSGKPGMFIAGADLKELGSPGQTAEIGRKMVQRGLGIIARIEMLPFPTIALIDGACLGGGLELALGFDYRLAGSHPKAELGFPEVKIGLFPGWGGTQRMTRIIGPSQALEMICGGDGVPAAKAVQMGFVFDLVASDKLETEGRRILAWSAQSGDWKEARRKKQLPVGLSDDQLSFTIAVARAQVLAKTKGQLPAPLAAVDAIEKGCNKPLDEGLKIETDYFVPLVGSTVSRNLIAIFFMTQRLQKDTGVADTAVQSRIVERVGVLGAGIMGAGIAGAHLRRGIPTLLEDVDAAALNRGKMAIVQTMQSRIKIGRMTSEEMLAALGQLSTATIGNVPLLSDRDVIVEAVVENEEVKTKLYRDLQPHLGKDAILASNTSTISITRMAQASSKPENFAGLHFFNPVDRMQLVEVIRGDKTSDCTVVALVALAKRLGKSPIVVRDCPGFLVNRILFPYINESLVLLEEGADPRTVDKAAVAFGMPMGPITLNDLVGLDTALYAGKVVNTAFADRAKDTKILVHLVKAGRLGQKTGAGFYKYGKDGKGADDPAFAEILAKCRTGQRSFEMEELAERLFLPMLVEASRTLEEGIVRDPGDVDMGLLLGIGFPAFRGGILRWADTVGLDKVLAKLGKYEAASASGFATDGDHAEIWRRRAARVLPVSIRYYFVSREPFGAAARSPRSHLA